MAKRGRPPKPTRLKILNGNPGKRPLNRDEPQFRIGAPTCPAHLDAEAKKEWRRVIKELTAIGMMTHVDRAALAAYCVTWSRWVKAEEKVKLAGEVLKATEGGFYQNPYLSVANKAMEKMRSFLSDFGMTPVARATMKVPGVANEQEDPLDRLTRGVPFEETG